MEVGGDVAARRWHRTIRMQAAGCWRSGVAGVPPAPGQHFGGDWRHRGPPSPATLPFLGWNEVGGDLSEPKRASASALVGRGGGNPQLPTLCTAPVPLGSPVPPEAGDVGPPATPRELLGPGAGGISPAAFGPPRASLTFSTGTCCPRARRCVYFFKKFLKKGKIERGERPPRAPRSDKMKGAGTGKRSAIAPLREMVSRCGSPRGKIPGEAGCGHRDPPQPPVGARRGG